LSVWPLKAFRTHRDRRFVIGVAITGEIGEALETLYA
jgi:hypothetical protein